MPLKKYITLIVMASVKDGIWISIFFSISVLVFGNVEILEDTSQMAFFVILTLVFAFVDEKISLRMKRWEYSPEMPKIFGVGITPLFELAVTGVLTFFYVL